MFCAARNWKPNKYMKLTKVERLTLLNQYRILEKVDPDNASFYGQVCEILRSGYTLDYGLELMTGVDPDEMSEDECHEVRDILDLYRALKKAHRELPEGTISSKDAEFPGFDGNEESKHFAYARFLIEDQNKWGESKAVNSHWPHLGKYRAMVAEWKESAQKWELTAEDVKRILSQK
jgi:uncharacterized protein YfbU (UPF0304 family)